MFKFLKEKLKGAVEKFTKDVEEAVEETSSSKTKIVEKIVEKPKPVLKLKVEEEIKEKTSKDLIDEKIVQAESEIKETISESKEDIINQVEEEPKKKGFFGRLSDSVTKKKLSVDKFDDLFWELEMALMESNIAIEVIEKIKDDLKEVLVDEKHSMFKTKDLVFDTLKKSISDLLDFETIDLAAKVKDKKPYVIAFVGVNGTGKTTNLAKLAYKLKNEGYEVVIAACDTFRAAAIQQIEEHANNLDIKLIKHDYGSDAAAVAFDAIDHAKAKGKDFVLIDTAGRNQSNKNLMEELKKLIRVSNPDLKLFVGDSLTGNDAVEQAKEFNEAVGIDGIILSKVDADEKGGASVSISYISKKPIYFVGVGQNYVDLKPFNKKEFLDKMGL